MGESKVKLKILFIYFRERGREGEREEEKYQCMVASHVAPTGNLVHNPGMWSDWELNQQPFDSQPELNPLSYTSQGTCEFSNMQGEVLPNPHCVLFKRQLDLFFKNSVRVCHLDITQVSHSHRTSLFQL